MEMSTYLSFKGDCEAAFRFYEKSLGAKVGQVFRYAGTPFAEQVPPDWGDKIMHASLTLGSQILMAADQPPERYEAPRGFSLSLQLNDTTEADRIFGELATEGKIVSALEKTFWAERFGVVVDRFGVTWLINCGG